MHKWTMAHLSSVEQNKHYWRYCELGAEAYWIASHNCLALKKWTHHASSDADEQALDVHVLLYTCAVFTVYVQHLDGVTGDSCTLIRR